MSRWIPAAFVLALTALLVGCSSSPIPSPGQVGRPQVPPDGRLHAGLTPYARVGSSSGYLQTPRGGGAGTTDLKRPTLTEIGATEAWEAGARLDIDYKRHRAWVEGGELVLHGSGTLTEDLTSQQSFFPAGTKVDSGSHLTMIGLGYNYLFEVPLFDCDRLQLRPGGGIRGVGVHYRLDGSNGAATSRHYTSFAPNLDLQWSWRPRNVGHLRFAGYVGKTIEAFYSDGRRMDIFEVSGRAHYDFNRNGSVFLETGYREIFMRDTQPTMQNEIKVDFGPWIGIGGELKF